MKSASMSDGDSHDVLQLDGRLTAPEVAELERHHRPRFEKGSAPSRVSLADVESGDSSALALLLEWQARALERGRRISFEHPPESLQVIARLTGVAPLLGWNEEKTTADSAKDAP
jgi:ABC-type transporter Mla MlaB component